MSAAGTLAGASTVAAVRALLDGVYDPEIPTLTIADLGVLRGVEIEADGTVVVVITPTYSGCPAMHAIECDIRRVLSAAGYAAFRVDTRLAPAWTTAWLTPAGRARLLENGIAPPLEASGDARSLRGLPAIACPRCGGSDTEKLSEFGTTACKALYRCRQCREPFDYFKCL